MRYLWISAILLATPAIGVAAQNVIAERQEGLDEILKDAPVDAAIRIRSSCVQGLQVDLVAKRRAAGFADAPDAPEYCATALARLGRDGNLSYVTLGKSSTPALKFDAGFVAGFRKAEPLTASTPGFAALRSVIRQCLAQIERQANVCSAAGYIAGQRAAHGERFLAN